MSSTKSQYDLKFEQRSQYLFAHVKADSIDPEAISSYLTEVADKRDETGAQKILVVREISGTLGIANQFHTTTDFTERMKGIKAAFVNPYPSNDEELAFAITVANNRGSKFKLFRDIEPAEKWLLRD